MKEKMQAWIQSIKEIEDYLNEHPEKDSYKADWPPDDFRDVLYNLEWQIELWIVELNGPKDIVRMIRGSQPVYKQHVFDFLTKIGVGRYIGGFVDEWRWKSESSECWNRDVHSLAVIYKHYCKQQEL